MRVLNYIRRPDVAWLLALMALSLGLAVATPFCVERQGGDWNRYRGARAGKPLDMRERLLQLDTDQLVWLETIADFPGYFYINNYRLGRPLYPALASLVARLSQSVPDPRRFVEPSSMQRAYAAALVVNVVLFVACVLGFFEFLLHKSAPPEVAWLSAALLALSGHMFWGLIYASTFLVSIGIVVASLWIFDWIIVGKDRWTPAVVGGLLLGLLMLGKEHYDVLVAGWAVVIFHRAWRAALVSFAAQAVPLAAWIGVAALMRLPYYSGAASVDADVVFGAPPGGVAELFYLTSRYPWAFLGAFGPVVLILAAVGFKSLGRRGATLAVALFGFALLNLAIILFGTRRCYPFYPVLLFPIVFPVAACGLGRWASRRVVALAVTLLIAADGWIAYWYTFQGARYTLVWPF